MQEDTVSGFLMRLEKLWQILREKEYDPGCNFILSTIHSSKGLEYDSVIPKIFRNLTASSEFLPTWRF